jgi:ATP-dependent DNA ligase
MTASKRNYRAMKDEKLAKVARELVAGGDAHRRVVNGGFDPDDDLSAVIAIAKERGLELNLTTGKAHQQSAQPDTVLGFIGAHLAAKGDPEKHLRPDWLLEPKLDGWWVQAIKQDGDTEFFLRSGADCTHRLPHIRESINAHFPDGAILVGELCLNGGGIDEGSHKVHELMRRESKDPEAKGTVVLELVLFDMLYNRYHDMTGKPFRERRGVLEEVLPQDSTLDFQHLRLIEQEAASHEGYAWMLRQGYEGCMVKDPDAPYAPGKRGAGMVKFKTIATVDAVIMEIVHGKGEFEGMAGSLKVGQYQDGELVARGHVSSGLNFDARRALWDNQDEFLGTALELRHMGSQSGGWRHPTFLRWRNDLDPTTVEVHDE